VDDPDPGRRRGAEGWIGRNMSAAPARGGYLRQAWLVIVLALVYGGGLAAVQTTLSGKIAENKKAETYDVIPDLVPGGDKERTEELLVQGADGKDARVYKVFAADGSHRGWVLPGAGQGFADRIDLLVGLSADGSTITGLYVLAQKETPGLADYITGEDFRRRFSGRPAGEALVVVRSDPQAENEIRTLSGATISSESVAAIVNAALANLRGAIGAGGGSPPGVQESAQETARR